MMRRFYFTLVGLLVALSPFSASATEVAGEAGAAAVANAPDVAPTTTKKGRLDALAELGITISPSEARLIDGEFTATITSVEYDMPLVYVDISGVGSSKTIRNFEFDFPHTVFFPTGYEWGQMTLVDADGDILVVDVAGPSAPSPDNPNQIRATPFGYINGGTGKYETATGGIWFDALVDLQAMSVEATMTGIIGGITRDHPEHPRR